MTEDEGVQVDEVRGMVKLLEELTLSGQREITVSRGSLSVMMSIMREKLAFTARLVSVDATAGSLQDHGHM